MNGGLGSRSGSASRPRMLRMLLAGTCLAAVLGMGARLADQARLRPEGRIVARLSVQGAAVDLWSGAFSRDARQVCAGERQSGRVWIWDLTGVPPHPPVPLPVSSSLGTIEGCASGDFLVSNLDATFVCRLDGTVRWTRKQTDACAISPEGTQIVCQDRGRTNLAVWRLNDGREVDRYTLKMSQTFPGVVCWSPTGQQIAVAGGGEGVVVLDIPSRRAAAPICSESEPVHTMAWSPNGRWLAVSASRYREWFQRGDVRIWNTSDGVVRAHLQLGTGTVYLLSWHPRGRYLAHIRRGLMTDTQILHVYDVTAGRDHAVLHGPRSVEWVSGGWTADGRAFRALSRNGQVWEWRIASLFRRT